MSQQPTRKFVEDGFGYLNKRNLDAFFALYSEDLRNPSLASMGLPTNKEGFKSFVGVFFGSFAEPQFLAQEIVCAGDTAMFRWIFKGVHTGELNGVKATGRRVAVDAFTSFRMAADGKIVEQHDLSDLFGLMKQIGA